MRIQAQGSTIALARQLVNTTRQSLHQDLKRIDGARNLDRDLREALQSDFKSAKRGGEMDVQTLLDHYAQTMIDLAQRLRQLGESARPSEEDVEDPPEVITEPPTTPNPGFPDRTRGTAIDLAV